MLNYSLIDKYLVEDPEKLMEMTNPMMDDTDKIDLIEHLKGKIDNYFINEIVDKLYPHKNKLELIIDLLVEFKPFETIKFIWSILFLEEENLPLKFLILLNQYPKRCNKFFIFKQFENMVDRDIDYFSLLECPDLDSDIKFYLYSFLDIVPEWCHPDPDPTAGYLLNQEIPLIESGFETDEVINDEMLIALLAMMPLPPDDDAYRVNHTLGPVNAKLDGSLCDQFPRKCRMLECQCFVSEGKDKWFTGKCQVCNKEITNISFALRYPYPEGGWWGCFCSFDCMTKEIPIKDDYRIKYLRHYFDSFKIYYTRELTEVGSSKPLEETLDHI